jgi:hypothetical protein
MFYISEARKCTGTVILVSGFNAVEYVAFVPRFCGGYFSAVEAAKAWIAEYQASNRLQTLCEIFGWNGGTIHQAKAEAENVIEDHLDVLGMPKDQFLALCAELKTLYPSYKAYRAEGHN